MTVSKETMALREAMGDWLKTFLYPFPVTISAWDAKAFKSALHKRGYTIQPVKSEEKEDD